MIEISMSDLVQRFRFIDHSQEPLELDIRHDGKAVHWVLPDQRSRFKLRSKYCAWRIDKFIVDGDPSHWKICDIRVQGKSQLPFLYNVADDPRDDGVPGAMFAADAPSTITFETVQTAMDVTIDVMYVGPNPEGRPFACSALCAVAR